ncbi:MAG: hypothetical protein JJ863_12185 [Deltaproteobacteria bacterium]|nr:hypothetical protein [Deltaproteobacteria bacterium]
MLLQVTGEPRAGMSLICTDRGAGNEQGWSHRTAGRGLAIVSAVMDELTFRLLPTSGLLVVGWVACPSLNDWPTMPVRHLR